MGDKEIQFIKSEEQEKYLDAIKSCFNKEDYKNLINLQKEYEEKEKRFIKDNVNTDKVKELFVGKYIKVSFMHNFPNANYCTYAFIKDVYVTTYGLMPDCLSVGFICGAFDVCEINEDGINLIGNFDDSRYIFLNSDFFFDFRMKRKYITETNFVDYEIEDNEIPEADYTKNGVMEFITEEEYKKVYIENTMNLYDKMVKKIK